MTTGDIEVAEEDGETHREQLERRAAVVRWKLTRTIDAIDRRRHELVDVGLQIRRHWLPVVMVGGIAISVTAVGVVWLVISAPARARRRLHRRWNMFRWIWHHPDDVLRAREPMLTRVVKNVAGPLLSAILLRSGKRALGLDRRVMRRR